ncbi:MAG: amidohydrolase family protein, partial [Psychromonas sp.]
MQKHFKKCTAALLVSGLLTSSLVSAQQVLFTDVNIFNGIDNKLYKEHNVLVDGNTIVKISTDTIETEEDAILIDADGRTLMPGLIDSHVHLHLNNNDGITGLERAPWQEIGAKAALNANEMLMEGFTTVRDMGGSDDGLQKLIDDGTLVGPRIYPAGSFISQTSGHFDFRTDVSSSDHKAQRLNITTIADGVPEVRRATRNNFANGATQIKIATSGGVTSHHDPLHTVQYSDQEIQAIVEEAERFDTYVGSHSITHQSINHALDNGVKSIEHGAMIDRDTAIKMKQKGAYLVANLAAFSPYTLSLPQFMVEPSKGKMETVLKNAEIFKQVIQEVQPLVVFQTDVAFADKMVARKWRDYEKSMNSQFYGNFISLKSMTYNAGMLAQETGKLNPYPQQLGVIKVGAYADILLVDGNPLEDMSVIGANP